MDSSSQQSYTDILEARILHTGFLAALYFSKEAGNRCEVATTGFKVILAQLREQDGEPGRKTDFDTESTRSPSSYGASEATEISDQLGLSTPSLTRYETHSDNSEFDVGAEVGLALWSK
jgi:hypothetical protein